MALPRAGVRARAHTVRGFRTVAMRYAGIGTERDTAGIHDSFPAYDVVRRLQLMAELDREIGRLERERRNVAERLTRARRGTPEGPAAPVLEAAYADLLGRKLAAIEDRLSAAREGARLLCGRDWRLATSARRSSAHAG